MLTFFFACGFIFLANACRKKKKNSQSMEGKLLWHYDIMFQKRNSIKTQHKILKTGDIFYICTFTMKSNTNIHMYTWIYYIQKRQITERLCTKLLVFVSGWWVMTYLHYFFILSYIFQSSLILITLGQREIAIRNLMYLSHWQTFCYLK